MASLSTFHTANGQWHGVVYLLLTIIIPLVQMSYFSSSSSSNSKPLIFCEALPVANKRQLRAEWISFDGASRIHPKRSGHVAFVSNDDKKKRLLVFGGYVEVDDENVDGSSMKSSVAASAEPPMKKRYVTQDLWEWKSPSTAIGSNATTASKSSSSSLAGGRGWLQVSRPSGDIPGPRLVSAGAIVGSTSKKPRAFMFGGWDPQTQGTGGVILDDVHQLDLDTFRWKGLAVKCPDGPTSRHVAVALADDRHILLHNHRCLGFVWLFDTERGTFTKQPTQGPFPSSRGLHAATRVGDSKVVLFGGAAQDQAMSNDVHILDTNSWEWSLFQPSNKKPIPSPRAGPCLCTYNSNCVLLFGGAEASPTAGLVPRGDVWALHLDQAEWQLLMDDRDDDNKKQTSGKHVCRPPPRNAATLSPISLLPNDNDDDDSHHKTFLLTGGWAPFRETWDDCFVLRVMDS